MAMASRLDGSRLRHARLLAEAGQRVIFAEKGDDRSALAPFTHQSGRDPRDILGNAETLMTQLDKMFGGGARLGVAHLRHSPDLVAQIDKARLDRVDAAPNVTAVVHARSVIPEVDAKA